MRPDVRFIAALRNPHAHVRQLLERLQARLRQNQLRVWSMAEIQAHRNAVSAAALPFARAQGLKGALAMLGLAGTAAIAAVALQVSGAVEEIVLGLLALLAVGGVFSLFGLLSGILRLGDRAADSEFTATIAEALDSGIQIVDQKSGAVLYSNAALQRLAGRRAARRATLEELLAGEPGAAQAFFRLNRAAERAEPWDEEFHVRASAGGGLAGRWLRVGVRPVAAPAGHATAERLTLWQIADITRERQRERETVSGLEATLAFYDDLPQGLMAVAPDGRIAHVNGTLAQWLGLRPDSGRPLTLRDFVSADAAALIRGAGRAGAAGTTRLELDLLREDGRAFPAQLVCRSHGTRGMTSVLVLERSSDLPQHGTRAEIEARLSRLFHAAPFGIATADREGRIVTANAAFARMFSIEDRAAPANMSSLVPAGQEEAGRALAKALERAISGRAGAAPVEVSFGARNELARRIYVSPLGVGKRGREGAILYAIDATEQKALELKFAQSHKMEAVGQLAGGVAHDFNNVLTAIIGFSDLLLQTHRPTDAAYRDIMNIKNSANRAAGLVRQLLAFSRRQTLQAEVLELGEVLTDLSALLNRALGEKIELKILPGRDLWHVKADKTQFEQVIINLAVNARDAMPDGGRLTIRTRNVSERESLKLADLNVTAGEYVLIEVEDTGIGMSAEVTSKIFEPFFTTKDVGKGTGLGLSTVYGIVKQTGGYVFAESEEGKGTTFRVYLPRHIVESEDELPQRADKRKEATRDLTGTGRVLLVEDEDVVRNFAARALSRQGYEVLEAGTGVEALDVMAREQGKIDIIVSDVIMPEMDGPSMLKEMRKTNPDIKIIFVSGYPDDAFKKSLDDDETYAFLPKPFTLPQLAAKVKEQLGR
jgi:two-component system cell cycle sensor histidine kinase/response regulator CckA